MNSTVTFRWRQTRLKDYYLPICLAVRDGHRTRATLLAALPQFSPQRLVLALESLIAAEMAWVELNTLVLSDDMLIVEALVGGEELHLPLDPATLKGHVGLLQEIFTRLGLRNPVGAAALLTYHSTENAHVD